MKACSTDFTWVTFISLSLLLLSLEALTASKQFQATAYDIMNNSTSICHDRFMSVYVPKAQYADLPFTIYVQGESDTTNTSYPSWHNAFKCLCYMLLFAFKLTHRWRPRILPSRCSCKTVPLLPGRNWNLFYLDSCFPWMFCKKTSKLKSHLRASVSLFQLQIYTIIYCMF